MYELNKSCTGRRYESIAEAFLRSQGYEILCRNYRRSFGEIDIIAREGSLLCFIEVKYRRTAGFGMPGEAVDRRKQQRILRVSRAYMYEQFCLDAQVRYDVVEILGDKIRVIRDAFGSSF